MPNLPNIFRQTTTPTVASSRSRSFAPGAPDPVPDPATGDLWIDMSQTPPVLKVLDGALVGQAIATPIGTPTGALQFNNAGAFGGVVGSSVGVTGKLTLAPTIANDFGVIIAPANSGTVGLLLSRPSGTADLFQAQNIVGTNVFQINADNTGPANPILNLVVPATVDKQALRLHRANAGATSDLFQVYDSGDSSIVFLVNPSGPTTGTVRIAPTVSNAQGLTINTTGNTTADGLLVSDGGNTIFRATTNAFNIAAAAQKGIKIGGPIEVSLTTQASPSALDIVLQTGPTLGSRLIGGSTFGTNDVTHSLVTGSGGWAVFENNVANLGVMLSTSSALPISIRPNRTETGQFPSGGGLVLFQAAPTVGASQVGFGATTATTATAGVNGATPAQVAGYLIVNIAGTARKIPFYVT